MLYNLMETINSILGRGIGRHKAAVPRKGNDPKIKFINGFQAKNKSRVLPEKKRKKMEGSNMKRRT